ncbi:LacI family DNA-binding transcriptional regulator [Companilactobacillus sp.]|uniref:LacI family DNA-binding transcriptional regulator n=1 Tax=Companilactobacillus sp. TaxID=2767905 RepID=UPI0025C4700F|nr:LacI family DNA-binding transcriptional regulator [Companilactobacillus sp.]MCH4008171.1 LacI family DNA-binding transcriptional regulator [Companilactobacillus sp.]MCH4051650.1 LacI family DNA-binding transcriptional regulator [Companilactobacillus sp.]MCH4076114.1 LacI family DNA-binding transcriptional regulator [Companilactobacillus sp.]MCH4124689.1 LacI family DNA-binding transcriptional regulator [Companilactobacillus sp.]MCH4131231.1 LacI family DNA-binding transcriptional regulator 
MVTIRDIAKKAGVSASTASRALNNNPHISKDTITKVQKIADKYGYMPDYNAKNLTTGEASAVGVIFPVGGNGAPANPFYVNVLSGVNNELIKRGYALSVAITQSLEDLTKNVKSMVYQSKIKRFILLYSQKDDPIAKFLRDNKLRFVVIGQPIEKNDYYVDNNNVEAGAAATRYLIEQDHPKTLAFVHSKNDWIFEQQRFAGFQSVVSEANLNYIDFKIDDDNADKLQRKIFENPRIDGAVATDDLNAMNFVDSFNKVFPLKNLEMIGFNNSLPHILLEKNYKTTDLFPEEMGKKAALLLFSDRENQEIDRKQHLIVGYKII